MKYCEHSLTTCTLETSTYSLRKGEEDSSEEYAPFRRDTAEHCAAGSPGYDALDSAALFVLVAVLSNCTQLTVLQNDDVVVTSCLIDRKA